MRHFHCRLVAVLVVMLGVHCANGPHLTEAEQQKLDPALQRLILDNPSSRDRYVVRTRPDGRAAYAVILRVTDAAPLREAGLPLGSVRGSLVTAYLTLEEIRTAAALPAVRYIENPEPLHPLTD